MCFFCVGFTTAWVHALWDVALSHWKGFSCGICLLYWVNPSPLTSGAWYKDYFSLLEGLHLKFVCIMTENFLFDKSWCTTVDYLILGVFYTWIRLCCWGLHLCTFRSFMKASHGNHLRKLWYDFCLINSKGRTRKEFGEMGCSPLEQLILLGMLALIKNNIKWKQWLFDCLCFSVVNMLFGMILVLVREHYAGKCSCQCSTQKGKVLDSVPHNSPVLFQQASIGKSSSVFRKPHTSTPKIMLQKRCSDSLWHSLHALSDTVNKLILILGWSEHQKGPRKDLRPWAK